ncbi:thermonuclease family protein [Microlunatus sp. Y2014]|uniref:thermonuclease family protein n=1 Tax=Microlunatus sp. Y2014 TaxID=3418488 RepID=UPI003DA70210
MTYTSHGKGRGRPYGRRGSAAGLVLALLLVFVAIHFQLLPAPWATADDPTTATVVRVIDGDTLEVTIAGANARVRLLAIDAPETGESPDCYGPEATRHLAQLLDQGSTIRLVTDPTQPATDEYGRMLAYVELDGDDIGQAMLAAGMARSWLGTPPAQRYLKYLATEGRSRASRHGLWLACTHR